MNDCLKTMCESAPPVTRSDLQLPLQINSGWIVSIFISWCIEPRNVSPGMVNPNLSIGFIASILLQIFLLVINLNRIIHSNDADHKTDRIVSVLLLFPKPTPYVMRKVRQVLWYSAFLFELFSQPQLISINHFTQLSRGYLRCFTLLQNRFRNSLRMSTWSSWRTSKDIDIPGLA